MRASEGEGVGYRREDEYKEEYKEEGKNAGLLFVFVCFGFMFCATSCSLSPLPPPFPPHTPTHPHTHTHNRTLKMAERRLKAATGKELAGISAAPTEVYARRFLRFMETNTCGAEPNVPLDYHLNHALPAAGSSSTEVAGAKGGLHG